MDKLTLPAGEKEQLEIYTTYPGSFGQGIATLKEKGLALITTCELAEARMLGGVKNPISTVWSWVAENFNYLPSGEILIASREYNPFLKNAAFLKNVKESEQYGRQCREFYLDKKLVKELREHAEVDLEKAVKSGVLLLSRKSVKSEIPCASLNDEPLTYFLFRDAAKQYGQFLKEYGLDSVPLYFADDDSAYVEASKKQKQPFGRVLSILCLRDGSGPGDIDAGRFRSCNTSHLLRGVHRAPLKPWTSR